MSQSSDEVLTLSIFVALFGLLTIWCGVILFRNAMRNRLSAEREHEPAGKPEVGLLFRIWFHRFMFLAALARTITLGLEIGVTRSIGPDQPPPAQDSYTYFI